MEVSNDIVLRPRFQFELDQDPKVLFLAFENVRTNHFIISRVDNHVFIRIPKNEQHFWSPQLHLEINKTQDKPTILKGLYGPNPTVWTLFMFLHFAIATLFIGVGIWLYTNISLETSHLLPLGILIGLFISWFVLYFAGRLGREAGKKQLYSLRTFLNKILSESGINKVH